jgi:hypothetical protein
VTDKLDVTQLLYDAVRYALSRAQTDPEFRWHMLGTETFARLIRAEAAYTGRSEQDVRAERETDRQPVYRRRTPECQINRSRVRELERLLEEHGIDAPPASASGGDE